jgi:hypothetical protein
MSLVGMNPGSSLQSLLSNYGNPSSFKSDNGKNDTNLSKNGISAAEISRSYTHSSLALEFTSDDGDRVSLSYESIEYSESITQLQTETDPEKIKELASYIKDQIHSMKNELMKKLFGSQKSEDDTEVEPAETSSKLPEYWNAENTSTRIVDFAVSFYGVVSTMGQEYLDKIKAAIEDGFKQARESIGELPDETEKLVSSTYDLVMQKLDSWAKDNGIVDSEKV